MWFIIVLRDYIVFKIKINHSFTFVFFCCCVCKVFYLWECGVCMRQPRYNNKAIKNKIIELKLISLNVNFIWKNKKKNSILNLTLVSPIICKMFLLLSDQPTAWLILFMSWICIDFISFIWRFHSIFFSLANLNNRRLCLFFKCLFSAFRLIFYQ